MVKSCPVAVKSDAMVPEHELEWSYARSGGPGGQNVNKVSSKAVLRWNLAASTSVAEEVKSRIQTQFPSKVTATGFVVIASQQFRDQERNRQACVEKLEAMIVQASKVPKARLKTKPSQAAKQRRLEAKKRQTARKAARQVRED